MDYRNFKFYGGYFVIHHTKETFSKTASGKGWKSKPDESKKDIISPANYENFVKSIPFFNGFFGGTCRAELSYTPAGYIPVKITSVSPDRNTKIIDHFAFEYVGK